MKSAAGGPAPAEGDDNATDSQHSELPLPPMEEDLVALVVNPEIDNLAPHFERGVRIPLLDLSQTPFAPY